MTGDDGRAAPRRQRQMAPENIDELVVALLRIGAVRRDAVRLVEPNFFDRPEEEYLVVLWQAVLDLHPQYEGAEAIPPATLYSACRDLAVECGWGSDDAMWKSLLDGDRGDSPGEVTGIIHHAYYLVGDDQLDPTFGRSLLKRFLVERGTVNPIARKIEEARLRGFVLDDVSDLLAAGQARRARFETLDRRPGRTVRRNLDRMRPLPVVSSGIVFLNRLMGGGPAAGEIIGLLGPTGGGKSTFVSQMAAARAKIIYEEYRRVGGPRRQVLCFSYEDPFLGEEAVDLDRFWIRTVAFAGNVDRAELEAPDGIGLLSRRGHLKPYELALFPTADHATFPGERERIEEAMALLERHHRVYDMTADGMGSGGVDEIVHTIECEVADGVVPAAVYIDSINLVVDQFLASRSKDPRRDKADAVVAAVAEIRRKVAVRFGVDVWVTNQLAAAMTKRGPGAALHHSDAAGSKGWSQALDFSIVFGSFDQQKLCTLLMSKARRGGCDGRTVTAQLAGRFARWDDRSDDYAVHNGEFVAVQELATIGGLSPRKTRATAVDTYDLGIEPDAD